MDDKQHWQLIHNDRMLVFCIVSSQMSKQYYYSDCLCLCETTVMCEESTQTCIELISSSYANCFSLPVSRTTTFYDMNTKTEFSRNYTSVSVTRRNCIASKSLSPAQQPFINVIM